MSSEIDQRIVEMKFENAQFENGVKNSISTLEKLKSALKFDTRADGFDQIQKSADSLNFSKVEMALDSIINRYSTFGIIGARVIEDLVDKALAGIDTVIGKIQSGGMSRALNLEQAKFQLQGLNVDWDDTLQSGIAKNVNDAVTNTAYGLDSAAKAASQLVASNVEVGDSMYHALRGIAGVASMTSSTYDDIANVFTRIAGNGKVMSQDLMSFSSRGLNAAAMLGEVLGHTEAEIRSMVHEGEINFEIFSEAMYKAFGEQAGKANDTFTGAMSNVGAALSRIGEKFATPYIQNMRPVLVELISFLKGINASISPLVDKVSEIMSAMSGRATETIKNLTDTLWDAKTGILHEATNWVTPISQGLANIIDGLAGAIRLFQEFWSTAFGTINGNPLLDFANTFREATSVFKYVFTGEIDEGSKAVANFISTVGGNSSILEDFKATITSIANVVNILYSKLLLVWENILEPLAMRVLPALLKYIRGIAEEAETIVKILFNNSIVDTAITGIGKGLTTVADLIFGIGNKSEDTSKKVKKAATETLEATNNVAKNLKTKTEDATAQATKNFEDLKAVAEAVLRGEYGIGDERVKALQEAGYVYEQVQNLVNEMTGNPFRYEVDVDVNSEEAISELEKIKEAAEQIYAENSALADMLYNKTVDSINSTFKGVDFNDRSLDFMHDTFFDRFYDNAVENGYTPDDARALATEMASRFFTEYDKQTEEEWNAWQDKAADEPTKTMDDMVDHLGLEQLNGKANLAFNKAWDMVNSKNKGKDFDELDYDKMYKDFYEESYKSLIALGVSEEEAIRRSLINKQIFINNWREMDEERWLIMSANAKEYIKTFDEMTPIEKIGSVIQGIVNKVKSIGSTIYDIAKSPVKTIWNFVKKIGSAIWTTVSSLGRIWDWVSQIYTMFTESEAFKEASEKFGSIKDSLQQAGEFISKIFEPFISKIKGFEFPKFDLNIAEKISKVLEDITKFFSDKIGSINDKLSKAKDLLKSFIEYDAEGNIDIFKTIHNAVDTFVEFIGKKATEFKTWFKSFFVLDADGNIDLWATIQEKAGQVVGFVTGKLDELKEKFFVVDEETKEIDWFATFEKVGTEAIGAVQEKFDTFIQTIQGIPKALDDFIGKIFGFDNGKEGINPEEAVNFTFFEDRVADLEKFAGFIAGIPEQLSNLATELGITGAFGGALKWVSDTISNITDTFDEFLKFVTGLPAAFEKTFGDENTLVGGALGFIADKAESARSALNEFKDNLKELFTVDAEGELGIIKIIRGGIEEFISFVKGIPGRIKEALDNVFGGSDTENNIKNQTDTEKEEAGGLAGVFELIASKADAARQAITEFAENLEGLFTYDENGELGIFKAISTLLENIKNLPSAINDAVRSITLFSNKNDPDVIKGLVALDEYTIGDLFDNLLSDPASVMQKIGEALSGAFGGIVDSVGSLFALNEETGNLGIFDTILEALRNFIGFLGETFPFVQKVVDWITGSDIGSETAEKVNEVAETITEITNASEKFVEVVAEEDSLLTKVFDVLTGTHVANAAELDNAVQEIGEAADTMEESSNNLENKRTIFQSIGDIVGEFIGLISTVFDKITQAIPNILSSAKNIIDHLPNVMPFVESAFVVLGDFVGGVLSALKSVFDTIHENWPELQGFLGSIGGKIVEIGSEGVGKVGEFFGSLLGNLSDAEEETNSDGPGMLSQFFEVLKTIFEKLGEVADVIIKNHDKIIKAASSVAIASLIWNIGQTVKAYRLSLGGGYLLRGFSTFSASINSIGSQILQAGLGVSLIVGSAEYINKDNNEKIKQVFETIGGLLTIIAAADITKSITTFLGKIVDLKAGNPLSTVFFNLSNVGTMIAAIGLGLLEIAAAISIYNNFTADELLSGLLKVSGAMIALSIGIGAISGLQGLASILTGGAASLVGVPAAIVALGAGLLEVIAAITWINALVDKEKVENDGSLGESLLIVTGAIAALAAGSFAIGASGASAAILATAGAIAALGGAFILLGVGLDVLSGTDFAAAITNVFDALKKALLGDVDIIDTEEDVQERVEKGKETVNKIVGDYVDGINQGISEIETENAGLDGLEDKMEDLEDGLNDALSAAETLDAKVNNGTNDEFERIASLISGILNNREIDLEDKIALIQKLKQDLEDSLALHNINNYDTTDYASMIRGTQPVYDEIVTLEPEAPPLAAAPTPIDTTVYEAAAQDNAAAYNEKLYSEIINADPAQYGVDTNLFSMFDNWSFGDGLDSLLSKVESILGTEIPEDIKSGLSGITSYAGGEMQSYINDIVPTEFTGTVDMSSYQTELATQGNEAISSAVSQYKEYIHNSDIPEEWKADAIRQADALVAGYDSKQSDVQSSVDGTVQVVFNELDTMPGEANTTGMDTTSQLASGISSNQSEAETAMQNVGISTHSKLDEIQPQYAVSGKMAVLGFASGITLNTYVAENAGAAMANSVIKKVNATLDNRSPSHVLEESGAFGALGFVKGILDKIPTVETATDTMANTFLDGLNTAADLTSQVLSDDFQLDPTIQPIIDMSQIQNGVAQIDGMFGQRSFEMAADARVDFDNQQVRLAEMMKQVDPINYSEQFRGLMNELHDYQEAILNRPTILDTGVMVNSLRPQMDVALGSISMRRNRGL